MLAFGLFRRDRTSLVLTPAIYVLGFTLIVSLALAEIVKPWFGTETDIPALAAAAVLSALFLTLGALHLTKLRVNLRWTGDPLPSV